MNEPTLNRAAIIGSIGRALEGLQWVDALWEGGSAAFGREDAWSDVDLQAVAEDSKVPELLTVVEEVLQSLSPISAVYKVPEPAWHGHSQRFYELERAGPFLMVDFCAVRRGNPNKFLERHIHGNAKFLFDKTGVRESASGADPGVWEIRLRERIAQLRVRFRMFQSIVTKECLRRRPLDSIYFYHALTLTPLVEMLRIKHDPWRHNFGWRYLSHYLPQGGHSRLVRLAYPGNVEAIELLRAEAQEWFESLATELDAWPILAPDPKS